MSQARTEMRRELADNPFAGIGEIAMQSVQLQWGWALLIVGAALVIAAAAVNRELDKERKANNSLIKD